MRGIVGAMLVTAALAASLPVWAQEVTVEDAAGALGVEGAFVEALDVQAVNVEVVVTDRQGKRVPDLTAADFRLLIDGKPVPIDYFAEVRDGRPVAAPGAQEPTLPPALSAVEAGEEVGTSYLVFIDDYFSSFRLRNEALKVMARDIHLLGERDRMAVVSFDGRRLHVLTDWTSPGPALEEALRSGAKRKGLLRAADFGATGDLRPFLLTGDRLEVDTTPLISEYEGPIEEARVARDVLLSAAAALRTFDPPAGRKVALVLSGGWMLDTLAPETTLETIQHNFFIRDSFPAALRPVTDTANLLGYTLYPIQLSNLPLPGAETRDAGNTTAFTGFATGAVRYAMQQGGLVFSAEETGGRFLKAGETYLKRIAEDTRSYYWLGFTSTAADNKRRDLKVELVREDLKVRSRTSFVPISSVARSAMLVEGALLTGRDIPHARPMEVLRGKAERKGPLTTQLPLTFRIPVEAITFLPHQGRMMASLQLWIASVDQQGRRSNVTVTPLSFSVAEAPGPGKRVVYRSDILVRRTEQEVVFALVDTASGDTLSARLQLDL